MSHMQAVIVHDVFGRIISINRPSKHARVVVLPKEGQLVLTTNVQSEAVPTLIQTHFVDVIKQTLVSHPKTKED
jgi:hypothetical protein